MTLSPRELEVLTLVGRDGMSYMEAANELSIAYETVRTYVARILERYPSKKRPRAALSELYFTVHTSVVNRSAD